MSPTPLFHPLIDLKNRFDFHLRNLIQWQKPGYIETWDQATSEMDFHNPDLITLAEHLELNYGLSAYRNQASFARYLENLTRLLELESCLPENIMMTNSIIHALDVGARNWSYVPALWKFIQKQQWIEKSEFGKNPQASSSSNAQAISVHLEGIELDAYRIYTDGYSRLDYATFFCKQVIDLENIHQPNRLCFLPGDVMKDCPTHHYDLVFCFLPFVFEEPLLDWGLPKHYFQPSAFLARLISLINDTGTLILVNQGEEEFEEQRRLLHQVQQSLTDRHFSIEPIGRLPNPFNTFKIDHWGWRISIKSG